MDDDVDTEIHQIIKQLACDAKSTRRTALLNLKKELDKKETALLLPYLFEPFIKVVASDPVDSLRESASNILLDLVSSVNIADHQFQAIIKLGDARLGVEPSEEIRLTLAKIIHGAVINQNIQQIFLDNLDGLTQLLKAVVRDRFGEVVKEACEIIIALSETNEHFRLQADYFVEPLLQNLKTQSMKVRIPCIKALEPVMIYSPLTIPNITPELEKSWSESSPSLKLAMVRTVGNVSQEIELDDQNFHYLLPVILLGKCNDFSEVSDVADGVWSLLENREGFHSQLGKCFNKLLPKLLQDAEDWNNDIRVQTSQLIYQFLHELPNINTDLAAVMELVAFQAGDQEAPVRNWAWRSSRLIGETNAKEALEWLASSRKENEVTISDVTIYSNIMRGFLNTTHSHSPSTVELGVELAIKFSSVKDVSLLECLEALLEKDVGIDAKPMNQLLTVVLSLEGEKESDFLSRQIGVLERIATRLKFPNVDSMIGERLPVLWSTFEEPMDKWTTTTLAWKILQFVAGDLSLINAYVFNLIRQTIISTSSPEIRLKSFNMLTASMEKIECDPSHLEAILLANIKWKPGRSSSVLRSCAALCAYTAIIHRKLDIVQSNIDVFADSFLPLVEDEVVNTRLAAIRILKRCLLTGRPTKVNSVLTTLMGRLNDVSKDVRHGVMVGLKDVFLLWRQDNSPHPMEKKFIELVRVLSRDDDLPSKSFAEGVLRSMLEECSTIVSLDKMNIAEKNEDEIIQ